MMSKKFIPVVILLTGISIFFTYQTQGKNEGDDPKERRAKVLHNVGILLSQGHYDPKPIDDKFSKMVLQKFTEELDDEKTIFLLSDINYFKKYENAIDDEISGKDIVSFYDINTIYTNRVNEVASFYDDILKNPFVFNVNETIQLDPEKTSYPKTKTDRYETWRKRLKYAVLGKFVDMQEDREKNKGQKDFIYKADSTLEREARDQVRKQMSRYFATKKSRETTDENFSTFVNAITAVMDPHTNYFPPVDYRSFNESMSGHFYGIGAQLKEEDGKIKISSLVGGGPAWKSGELKEDDEILKVAQSNQEPVDVTGYAIPDAVKLIRGSEKGTEVRLTVKKVDGSIKVVSLIRDDIKLEDTFAKSAIIQGKNKIGYIYLPEFYADFEKPNGPRCSVDMAREVEKLKSENVDGIIIDLRGNGGGSLYDVVQMAGLFIPSGPICQVKGKDEKPTIMRDRDSRVQYDGPLAVMVDGTSASASEIFAAAIQDYQRGVIIGSSSTYGKGTVQRSIALNPEGEMVFSNKKPEDLGAVKLTLQKFYRINGGATQQKGVIPDVILPNRYDYLKFREKDTKYSFPWDEIDQTDYKPWSSNYSLSALAKEVSKEVSTNAAFSKIKQNTAWLDQYSKREYSLNINQYKADQKQLKSIYKDMDSVVKLSAPMNMKSLEADAQSMEGAEEQTTKNKQWIDMRNKDVYIDESVKIIEKMIQQGNLVIKQ